jgi:hypothetical protein
MLPLMECFKVRFFSGVRTVLGTEGAGVLVAA